MLEKSDTYTICYKDLANWLQKNLHYASNLDNYWTVYNNMQINKISKKSWKEQES